MMEVHPDMQEDYETMCRLIGPLDASAFRDEYRAYERWKSGQENSREVLLARAI